MNINVQNHYDKNYFNNSQKGNGKIGGKANLFKFEKYIKKSDKLLDFGCGGGFLLANIQCDNKIGVEINPIARKYCREVNKQVCFENLSEIENDSLDIIISNHCLEHVTSPFDVIAQLYTKLKPGGRIIICVPLDTYTYKWRPNDHCNHLYSFSPMNLGNLLQGVGFKDIEAKAILHKWVPKYRWFLKTFGFKVFDTLSFIYGNYIYNNIPFRKATKWNQTWVTGIK